MKLTRDSTWFLGTGWRGCEEVSLLGQSLSRTQGCPYSFFFPLAPESCEETQKKLGEVAICFQGLFKVPFPETWGGSGRRSCSAKREEEVVVGVLFSSGNVWDLGDLEGPA